MTVRSVVVEQMDRSGIDANKSVAHRSSEALPLSYLQRYGLAVVSIGVALGISLLLQHFGFRVPSALLLLFAVAISSWYAGAGPAVLAAILSTISFYWYFVEPVHTIYINRSEIPYFVIFAAFAALLSRFGTFRQRAEADLRRTHDQLNVERLKLGSRTIALLYFTFSSCWILFTDRLVHGLGLSNAYLLKVSEAKGILFISLSTLLMYVLVEKALRQRHSVATAYWQLVETAQEGVWSVDAEGKTVFANENMAAILGTSPGEMIGKSILPFVPQEKKDELLNHLLQREQRLQEHYEFPFLRADGAQVWALLRISPVLGDGQDRGCLALVSDITERKRAEEALRRLNRELRAISNCNQTLLRATDEQTLLKEICRIVCEEAGYRMAWVGYAQYDEAKSVRPVAWTGAEEGYLASAGITWADTDRGRGPTGEAIRSGKSCCVQAFATDPRMAPWRESLLQHGFRSGIALPLKDENDNAFGSLTVHSAQPDAFTSEEIRLLEELAGDMAFGIVTLRSRAARKRAELALRRSEAYLAEGQRLSHTGSWALDVASDKWTYWSEEMFRIFGFDSQEGIPARKALFGRILPEDRTRVEVSFQKSLRERVDTFDQYRIALPDGTIKHIHIIRHPVLNEAGEIVQLVGPAMDITERKRAEEKLRQSEAELRQIVGVIPQQVFVFDSDWSPVFANRRELDYTGLTPQEAKSKEAVARIFHPEDLKKLEIIRQRASSDGAPFEMEARIRGKEGEYRWFLIRDNPLRDEQGRVLRWYGTRTDIEERKRAEEALRRSEAYLAEAERINHSGTWAWNPASGIQYWSKECYGIMGFDPDEGVPSLERFLERIHPDDLPRVRERLLTVAREKTNYEDEYRIVRPNGEVRDLHIIGHPVFDSTGNLLEYIGTTADVTERKRAEEALRRSEAYLAEAQRLTHTGSWATDAVPEPLYWSEELFRLYGLDPQDGLPTHGQAMQRVHPEDRDKYVQAFHRAIHQKVDSDVEFRTVLPDGTVKHLHGIGHPVLNANGEVVEVVGTTADITERKRAEDALREGETRFRTFVDHAGDALFVYDLEHRAIVDVNRSACEGLGYTREEMIGKTSLFFHLDSDRAEMESAAERAAAGETVFDRHWHRRKDGSTFPVEAHTSLVSYGGHRFLLKVARDISDRLRAEEQRDKLRQLEADLAHIDRVSILGELTASIAHEVNQPLSGIVSSGSACLRWLARDVPDLEEAREAARRIVRDGKRAGEIIARIRALTKKAVASGEKLDLNKTIREVLALVGDEAKRNAVLIRTRFGDDVFPVLGDQVQLQQVVLNLAMNAIEAMSKVDDRARELVITTRNIDPDQVLVTVEDSGTGIDPQMIDKVFDSFYTTKPSGMGMGLSISRSILQAHGGRLWATAKDGPGTTFHFTLPKYHEEESDAGA
jgi:PAS domain S-box-containing protein